MLDFDVCEAEKVLGKISTENGLNLSLHCNKMGTLLFKFVDCRETSWAKCYLIGKVVNLDRLNGCSWLKLEDLRIKI